MPIITLLRSTFTASARKVYRAVGFTKGYNFVLWLIFGGTLFAFSLIRLEYIDFWGVFCNPDRRRASGAMPGECFYFMKPGRYQIGIILHLATILPASLLAVVQFVPIVRQKAMYLHRINGYISVFLSIAGTAGALMIARHSAGGGVDVQTFIGALAILFLGSMCLAMINIRRLQIDQHRAWMIRAWVYGSIIITMRIGLIIGALIVSAAGGHYMAQPCDKINHTLKGQNITMKFYPECAPFFSGENLDQHVAVKANFHGDNIMEIATAFNIIFGPASWVALIIHMIGTELYLRLTPAEHERLRNVSYHRQLKAGMKNPGSAGWTADWLGDANKWVPKTQMTTKIVSDDNKSVQGAVTSSTPLLSKDSS
ncbi:hypothetical protein GGS24DRAFT_60549 [Hypoxylon argillaceum]|nr:hypothetical protein GGS24DRAFT_60549 [Hypoxylon argillaceum]